MTVSLSRRALLSSALRVAAGLSAGIAGTYAPLVRAQRDRQRAAGASTGGAAATEVTDLGGGLRVLTVGATNVLASGTDEGIVLVDGVRPELTGLLREQLAAAFPGAGVHTLLNTHWHPEHTGSNAPLAQDGATIVSHENTRLWLTTDVTWPWSGETVEPLPKSAQPTRTFRTDDELVIGGTRIYCGYLSDCPHTDGDIYVRFPDANIIAVGDAVTGEGWPELDWWTGGWIGGLVGGLDRVLSAANTETRFVPARGPVLDYDAMVDQLAMYGVIWERLVGILNSGGGPEEAHAAEPTKEFNDAMGDPHTFVQRAFESLWAYMSPDA